MRRAGFDLVFVETAGIGQGDSRIVDLVSTGRTLKDNGLAETSVILQISARLIVNRAALKTDERVAALVERFRAIVSEAKAA